MTARLVDVSTRKSTDFKHVTALVVLFKHIQALTERLCAYWPCSFKENEVIREYPRQKSVIYIRTDAVPSRNVTGVPNFC